MNLSDIEYYLLSRAEEIKEVLEETQKNEQPVKLEEAIESMLTTLAYY